ESVHRGTDGPSGVQNVVDQDDGGAVDVEVDPRLVDLGRLGAHADVVAIEGDVENADRHPGALDPLDLRRKTAGKLISARGDPDQHQTLRALVALEDLVRDPGDRPADLDPVEEPDGAHQNETPSRARGRACIVAIVTAPFPASRDRT